MFEEDWTSYQQKIALAGQNIWPKVKESRKCRQDRKLIVSAFTQGFTGIANN